MFLLGALLSGSQLFYKYTYVCHQPLFDSKLNDNDDYRIRELKSDEIERSENSQPSSNPRRESEQDIEQ